MAEPNANGGHIGFLPVKKVSPRVAEFGDFEHVFVCVSLSNGAKIPFGPICFRFCHSTAGLKQPQK